MLDVIVMDNRPHSAGRHERCVASVQAAIAFAGFHARLVETEGNLADIAKARIAGFDKTTAPYVTWVVDFDYLLPDALSTLAPHFAGNPSAIFTRELHETGRVRRPWPHRHHLAVYRRDVIEAARGAYETLPVDAAVREAHKAAERMGVVADALHHGYVRCMERDVARLFKPTRAA